MRAFALFLASAIYSAVAVISSPLTPRARVCMNDGKTIAGTVFHSRDLPETTSLHARDGIPIPCIWCQIGGATYIIVTQIRQSQYPPSRGATQTSLLQAAIRVIGNSLHDEGDHLLRGGAYELQEDGVMISASSWNNHQMTLGVLQSAMSALRSFMSAYQIYGLVIFNIYDGANWVGVGTTRLP